MPEITIQTTQASRIQEIDFNNIPFGRVFTDHMFEADYIDGDWVNQCIKPFGNLSLSPALSCMHYGQAIFEGMKAMKGERGEIFLFRPKDNASRFNNSARRMCMPELPEELFMNALTSWLCLDHEWIPTAEDSALYIRPLMIATDDYLGVKASENYKFLVYGCPVSGYYNEPLRLRIEEFYIRAAKGGVGQAKAAGNYAAAMYPASLAQKEGFHQLLWTDAQDHKYIEELGTSNFFAVVDNELYTPGTDGTILEGITRDSIIQLARHQGLTVHEAPLAVDFLIDSYNSGLFTEAFATGTAAAIAPIGKIQFRDKDMKLQVSEKSVTAGLSNELMSIKNGSDHNFGNWCHRINNLSHQSNL